MDIYTTWPGRLDERAKAFHDEMAAAETARHDDIDARLAEAQTRAAASRALLSARADGAGEAFEAALAAVKQRIRARGGGEAVSGDADRAERDAADAEDYANQLFDMALACLDEAEIAAIAANYARDRAHVFRHEGGAPAPDLDPRAAPDAEAKSGVGAKVGALVDQVVGSAKADLGKATGKTRLEAEGAAQEAKGHLDWTTGGRASS